MKNKFLFLTCGWMTGMILTAASLSAHATTNLASSVSEAAVSAALNISLPGDTVVMPAGTGHWTVPLEIRGVNLVGQGTNQTIIIDDMDRNANPYPPLIMIHGAFTNILDVGNFQLAGGSTTRNWHGEVATDYSGPIRIHDIYFNQLNDKALMLYGANLALVDHCYFNLKFAAILIHDIGYGDASWAAPANYGTALMPVIEDCVFNNTVHTTSANSAVDVESGGRVTFRHNQVLYTYFEVHGTESGGRLRGGRMFEVYSNTFIHDPSVSFPITVNLRAGAGVFYGNTATGYSYFANINVNRATERFNPWRGGDGTSPWDDNVGSNYLSGVHSGPNGATFLQVAGANWTPNQWVGYTVINQDWTNSIDHGGWVEANGFTNINYSVIFSNNANRIFYHVSKDWGWMYFTNGNHFVINRVNHLLDQPGMGSGDLITGELQPWGPDPINTVTGVASWPRENVEGIYSWNNTLNGADAGFGSDYPHAQAGREFFNDTPKPGYTPLVYPHPLQSGTNGYRGSGGGGTNLLQPPARVWVQF